MSKSPQFKLVRYSPGSRGNTVLWRGDMPITRTEVEERYGPGKYVLFMYGPGIRGMKPYDKFCVTPITETRVFAAEPDFSNETWGDDTEEPIKKGPTLADISDSQLFEALDRVLEADIRPEHFPRAKERIKAILGELRRRGTTKEQWEGFAADKGGDKLLYMLGGVLAGGALGAIAVAYYYNGKLKALEEEMQSLKAQLYQTQQQMSAPKDPDMVILRRYNQQHGGKP